MYVRRTLTRTLDTGERYYSHRLVRSERAGGRVRQVTLLNLGRHFTLPPDQWQWLCVRIDELLAGLATPAAQRCEPAVEREAQRLAALLLARQAPPIVRGGERGLESLEVDSLELTRPRSVGVEQVALWALGELQLAAQLQALGLPRRQVAAVLGMIVARMAAPAAGPDRLAWWSERSAIGELLGVDFAAFGPTPIEGAGDSLLRFRKTLEEQTGSRLRDLFAGAAGEGEAASVYRLTDALCCATAGASQAHPEDPGQSHNEAAPTTLGLVLDGSGFVCRSASFVGAVAAGASLKTMLGGLGAPPGALVAIDPGAASPANLAWLSANGYRYLAMGAACAPACQAGPADATIGLHEKASAQGRAPRPYDRSPDIQAQVERSRGGEAERDADQLGRARLALADFEAVLQDLGCRPDPRPAEHGGHDRAAAAGLVCVLAYQCVQLVRHRLAASGIATDWQALRQILAGQMRVTASLRRDDGRTLHVRKATRADPELLALYEALGIDPAPGPTQSTIV